LEKGEAQRQYIIARKQRICGNTLGALAVVGNQWLNGVEPLMVDTSHIPHCYPYRLRHKTEIETGYDYGQRSANYLAEEIDRVGSGKVMAFIAGSAVGATLNAVAVVDDYF
jgi:adenosylmethionine-8-amino-7-oxononanoate aminotransferase